jgi:hypothetical protein
MQESINPPIRNSRHSTEFLIGQHSLFLAGLGQGFFYVHQFAPHLPAGIAGPLLLLPWGIVFILFYHERPVFPVATIRRWWLRAAGLTAILTVVAELIWILGFMPPPGADHRIQADILVQVLLNLGWLSFVPMIRDHRNNPELWK